jgi:hypothetical protein
MTSYQYFGSLFLKTFLVTNVTMKIGMILGVTELGMLESEERCTHN